MKLFIKTESASTITVNFRLVKKSVQLINRLRKAMFLDSTRKYTNILFRKKSAARLYTDDRCAQYNSVKDRTITLTLLTDKPTSAEWIICITVSIYRIIETDLYQTEIMTDFT